MGRWRERKRRKGSGEKEGKKGVLCDIGLFGVV